MPELTWIFMRTQENLKTLSLVKYMCIPGLAACITEEVLYIHIYIIIEYRQYNVTLKDAQQIYPVCAYTSILRTEKY